MDTNRDSAHQSQNDNNFPTFSLGLKFLNEVEKEKKTTEKETRHKRSHDSLRCPGMKCNKFWQKDTLVKLNKWKTGLFQPSKVSLNFSVLKLLNIYLKLFSEIVELTEKLSAKVLTHLITSNYRCSDNSLSVWFSFTKITFKWFLFKLKENLFLF